MYMDENPFGSVDVYIDYLMQHYQPALSRYVSTLTKNLNGDDVDDIVAEAFEQTYFSLRDHQTQQQNECLRNPLGWLKVVARNIFYNSRRRRSPSTEHSLEALREQETGPLQALVSIDALPEKAVVSNEGISEIWRHMDALPGNGVREPTVLFFGEELSYAEISASLGRPLGTVKNQIHRGRKALQEGLRPRIVGGET